MLPSCDTIGTMERVDQQTVVKTHYRFFCEFCTIDHSLELTCQKMVDFMGRTMYGVLMRTGVHPLLELASDNPMEPILRIAEICDGLGELYGIQDKFKLVMDNAEEFFGCAVRDLN